MTYEDALETLCSMFQSWDRETIIAIFQSNGYHVERTIETILSMEQPDLAINPPPQQQEHPSSTAMVDLLDLEEHDDQPQLNVSYTSSDPKKRGIPCSLPDDFLRLPGQKMDSQTLQDEHLAMMLQNEMFQREVEQALGPGHPFSSNYYTASGERIPRRAQQQHASTHGARSTSTNQQQQSSDPDAIPDLGIMKALSDMGEGMRNQLTQLALAFNNTATAASTGSSRSRSNSQTEGRQNQGDVETRPLTGQDYEEEDDEEGPFLTSPSSSATSSSVSTRRTAATPSRAASGTSSTSSRVGSGGKKDK